LKHIILNEFCLNTGYHRKHAIRLVNGTPPGKQPERGVRRRRLSYGQEVLSILAAVWEAAGYPWSVRLKALLPLWMPSIAKRFRVSKKIERQLLSISPRQMDRRLRAKKTQRKRRIYGCTKPGLLLKHNELANRRLSPKVPKELPVPEQNKSSRRNGCGKDARSASLEITKRFPLSHSHDDGAPSPSVTLQMARRCALRLHS
jgi:hypothetical protein